MIRKIFILLLLLPLSSIFGVRPASAAKFYDAEFFDVQIDLQEDSSSGAG